MTVLMVGGGGREHALIRKLKESPRVDKVYCAPATAAFRAMRSAEMWPRAI